MTQPTLDAGPGSGHQFRFSVTVQGSYSIEGDPRHYDSDPDTISDPFCLTVRAWSLAEACREAAQMPFHRWEHTCSEMDT